MRTMARTAVISGTAQATMGAVNRRQMQKNAAAYPEARANVAPQPAPVAPAAAAPSPGAASSMDDKLANLERLSQLKAQGILTDEEFAAQKAIILAG